MKIQYFKADNGNFGDDLNQWIWDELCPGFFDDDPATLFLGIGTIIGRPLPAATKEVFVFSSGIGYRPPPRPSDVPHTYICVRGPLTAKVLGIAKEKSVGDGALLLRYIPEFKPVPIEQRRGTIFIPHFEKMQDAALLAACELAGVSVIDPRSDARNVIDAIRNSSKVIADSMHAAIVADTLRVPWVPVVSSTNISSFKWLDWSKAVGLPYEPTRLPQASITAHALQLRERLIEGKQFTGSSVDAALKNYRELCTRRNRAGYESWKNLWNYRTSKIGVHCIDNPVFDKIDSFANEMLVENLAKAIDKAKSRAPYLSDEGRLSVASEQLLFLLKGFVQNRR